MVRNTVIKSGSAVVSHVKIGKLKMFANTGVIALREVGEWCTENG